MISTTLSHILRIGSTVIMARMLLPEHFGLVGMVTALIVFAERFKDLGLSLATVQRKEITHEQVSTLFWINTGMGMFITLLVAALSPLIAWFYNSDTRLIWISLALSSGFFFGGLTIQHQALLRRQMRFGSLSWIQILSNALSIALGIGLAWKGFEYWALVWKEVSRAVFIAAATWLMCRWVPGLPERKSGIGSMLRFGRDITGFDFIQFFSRSLDQILIGKFWGASPLGYYRQAYQLMLLPIEQFRFPVQYVAEPMLSTLQNDHDKYRQYYKKIVSIVSFLSMPIAVYLCIFPENLVLLLLGEKWIESAAIFRVLALAAFIQPVASTCGFVMITCGKTKRYFWWGIISAICTIAAFLVGIPWGPIGVAVGYTVATYAIFVFTLWFSFKDTPISVSLFFKAIYLPLISSLVMAVLLIIATQKIIWLNSPLGMLSSLLLSIITYCGLWFLLPGGKQKLFEYISYPLSAFKLTPSFAKKNGRI